MSPQSFQGKIVISRAEGSKSVVTLKDTADALLREFYKSPKTSYIGKKK